MLQKLSRRKDLQRCKWRLCRAFAAFLQVLAIDLVLAKPIMMADLARG